MWPPVTGAAALVNPVGDGRATFSAPPSPFGPWEEKERRKGAGGWRGVKRKGEEQGGKGSRWRQTQGRGKGERQALSLLMAVSCG